MKKHGKILSIVLAAALLCTGMTVFAEEENTEETPAETTAAADADSENTETESAEETEEDVVMLYTGTNPDAVPDGDPLLNYLNEKRDLNGSGELVMTDELKEQAAARVEVLADGTGSADAAGLSGADACEIVVRGSADINTMLSALLMSKRQSQTLYYSGFGKFGYAHNADETIWVL